MPLYPTPTATIFCCLPDGEGPPPSDGANSEVMSTRLSSCFVATSCLPSCLVFCEKKQSSTLVKNGGRQWRLPFVSRWCLIAIFLREVESFVSLLDYVQKGASRHAMFMYMYMLVFYFLTVYSLSSGNNFVLSVGFGKHLALLLITCNKLNRKVLAIILECQL